MSNELTPFVEKGMTEDEAKLLTRWIQQGKPGLSKFRADKFAEIYVLGYSCQDIHKWFDEYPLETILWARFHYDWDALRADYKKVRTRQVMETALGVQEEGVRFLTELLHATHYRWRKELMEYLANPDTKKAPDCLPNSLSQYASLTNLMREVMGMAGPKDGKGNNKDSQPSSPLVSIHMNDEKKPSITVAGPEDVKSAILEDVKNAERVQRQ